MALALRLAGLDFDPAGFWLLRRNKPPPVLPPFTFAALEIISEIMPLLGCELLHTLIYSLCGRVLGLRVLELEEPREERGRVCCLRGKVGV